MANLNETSAWIDGIYQLEQTDVVRGGAPETGGIANKQAQQLADRTLWLKNNLKKKQDINILTVDSNKSLADTDILDKNLFLNITAPGKKLSFDLSSLPEKTIFNITALRDVDPKLVWLYFSTPIVGVGSDLYIYSGESLSMMYYDGNLYIIEQSINLDEIGTVVYSYVQPALSLPLSGQLVGRALYPRLWQKVNDGSVNLITDSQWNTQSPIFMGYFSSGDGATNFRLPDLRGVFIRSHDKGRGLDVDRLSTIKDGSYQLDGVKKHSHKLFGGGGVNSPTIADNYNAVAASLGDTPTGNHDWNYQITSTGEAEPWAGRTSKEGGTETRPINVALTAYIKY